MIPFVCSFEHCCYRSQFRFENVWGIDSLSTSEYPPPYLSEVLPLSIVSRRGTKQINKHSPRSRSDDNSHFCESSRRSRIHSCSPIYRETIDNGEDSKRYPGRYSDVDKRSIPQTFLSRNEIANDSDTSSAEMNKQFESSNNRWHFRNTQNSEWEAWWEAIPRKKKVVECRLVLSNGYDFL